MSANIDKSADVLELKSYPRCLVMLCIALLLVILVFGGRSEQTDVAGLAIGIGVCVVFIVLQKSKRLTLNKITNTGLLTQRWIFGRTEMEFRVSDIASIEMVYGRGSQHARGGAIGVFIADKLIIVADSDICFGNRQRTIRLKEVLEQWM